MAGKYYSGERVHKNSTLWHWFILIFAFISVGAASFMAGIIWQIRHTPETVPTEQPLKPTQGQQPIQTVPAYNANIRAEFNPQSALLIGANELVRFHQSVFKSLVSAVHERIPIFGVVNDEEEMELGREFLDEVGLPAEAVHFIKHPLDSMWIRDYGPLFTRWRGGNIGIVHSIYDMPDDRGPRKRDADFCAYLGDVLGLDVKPMPLVMEGGNILSNGDGLMITSTWIIDRPQNRHYSLMEIGKILQQYLGCKTWVYLRTLEGERTGHIDLCVTFLRRNLVLVGEYDHEYDSINAAILDEMADILKDQTTSMGPMVVKRIPMPPRSETGAWRSYTNVLILNSIILVPSYSDVDPELEAKALDTYRRLMPTWKIIPINSDTLVEKRGVLHCIGVSIPGFVNILPLVGEAM